MSTEQVEVPLEIVRDRPSLALEDVVDAFGRASGVTISAATVSTHVREAGFERVLPKRWIIERTNAWNDRPRRLNKDHDRNLAVSEGWLWLAEGRRLLCRVTAEMLKHA